ncbi:conserved exported hypothetical protein [Agrobacterium fabacearum CFBP 5771]|nr:conserved exported hypothetical protein [Agrobacterium fabacearum TT111]CUW96511.1 conserved exported hypothetical protein [Agrobacterium fabacearum S56]CVI16614.1 conserved exported hypothetical protein [Agrobacterium fabacearum CFBP 5771]
MTISSSPSISPSSISSTLSLSCCSSAFTPLMLSSSCWRSRISFCASVASFQRVGSSALLFNQSSRLIAWSQSKMPPQQAYGLLDFVDYVHNFIAHFAGSSPSFKLVAQINAGGADVKTRAPRQT